MVFENVMKTLMAELKEMARTDAVVGKPVVAGNSTVIPVSKISLGAGGGGTGSKDAAGVAGGASITPVAFIVITDGKVQLLPIGEKTGPLSKVIDLIPELVDKLVPENRAGDENGSKE